MSYFVDVVLPLPLENTYTYSIDEQDKQQLQIGSRVIVSFGKTKYYTAVVVAIHQTAPRTYQAKPIDEVLDQLPLITNFQLKHWFWIAKYYMCSLGEVYKTAVPSALMLESDSLVCLSEDFDASIELSDTEYLIVEALKLQGHLLIKEVSPLINRKTVMPVLQAMVVKNIIELQEHLVDKYKPKYEKFYALTVDLKDQQGLEEIFKQLQRAKKQLEAFTLLCALNASKENPISARLLEKQKQKISRAQIKSLEERGLLSVERRQIDRVSFDKSQPLAELKELNSDQREAFERLNAYAKQKETALLFGVTSSGKTEVYVHLIAEQLTKGNQVLYLVPEIALTVQLIKRLQNYFGDAVVVYHSKYNNAERVEAYLNVINSTGEAKLIVGARSALLLPFVKLGLIVVDEEHESSYKQYDPAPRYHARDAAIYLSKLHDCGVILGSATPSIESMYNAKSGKYKLVELKRRFENVHLPEIQLIDLKRHHLKKEVIQYFSIPLLEAIDDAYTAGKQIILFQNRRGYAPVLECERCGHTPECPHCDVSLTFHQHTKQLRCHYCGYSEVYSGSCKTCGSLEVDSKGLGTEQVVESLSQLRPNLKIGRLDYDTTRTKNAYDRILSSFEEGQIDVLVGTQMVAKGLDFSNVALVGVMNADHLLNFPDYTAHEKAFQMLTQVAGRSGRFKDRGKVLIQTYNPYHEILRQVSDNDYEGMFKEQLYQREIYKYPPQNRLVKITFKDRDYNKINEAAHWYAQGLRTNLNQVVVLGPEFPSIARVKNQYIKHIVVKIPKAIPLAEVKNYMVRLRVSFHSVANYKSVKLVFNVDYI